MHEEGGGDVLVATNLVNLKKKSLTYMHRHIRVHCVCIYIYICTQFTYVNTHVFTYTNAHNLFELLRIWFSLCGL